MATQTVSSTPSSSKTNSIADADDNSDSDIISTARVESVTRPREVSPAGVAAKQTTNSGLRTSTTKESVHQTRAAAWNGSETNPQPTYYPHHLPSQSGEETKREENNSSANHQHNHHHHHHRHHSQRFVLIEDEKHRDETNPSPHPHHHHYRHHHRSHSPLRSARRGLNPSVVLSSGTIVRSASPEGSSLARTLIRDSTLLTASRPAFGASDAAQGNDGSSLDSDNDGNNSVTSHTTLGAEYLDGPETQVSRYTLQTADCEYLHCGDTKAAHYLQTANSEYLDSRGTKVSRYLQTVNSEENYCETETKYDHGGLHLNDDKNNSETPITTSPENGGTADLGLLRNFKTRGSTNLKPESGTGSERCADDRENYSSSSGKNSKKSEDNLQRRVEDSWINSSSPQFRRLESRRGSSVTFILPAHASTGDNSSQSSSRHQSICTEEAAQIQERFSALYARRMSAPELPPIADRERHRPPSRSNSKSSLNQLTAAVNNKNFYTRLTNGATLHRNHSDSSLKGLLAASLGPTQSSGSVSSYPSGGGGLGGGGSTPGPGDGPLLPPHLHMCSSRAMSWCATDNSAGSIAKLETLFERKNAPGVLNSGGGGGGNNSTLAVPGTPPSKNHNKNNNNNNNLHAPNNNNNNNNLIPPRSVSVSAIRRSDSQELAKIKGRKKRLQSESGAAEVETLATIEQFGRLTTNGMKRSVSDNKLVEKKNIRNARLNSSRHISVGRTDKLTSRKSTRHGTSTVSGTRGMRRVCSVSAINNVERRTRIHSNQDTENVDGLGGGSEDSEEEEERSYRIREWLLGLDCADAPPEPVIEYADDPPQTDTALHVVYGDES